jgi:hypothetical protein
MQLLLTCKGLMDDVIFTDKAFVDYGEVGSTRVRVEDGIPTNVQEIRKAFAEKVEFVQTEEGGPTRCGWGDAVAIASKKFPELAKAYIESDTPAA